MWREIRARLLFYGVVYIGGTALFLWLSHKFGWWGMFFP